MDVPAERLHKQITLVLTAWGMDADLADTTADVLVDTDLAGVDSHGVSMVMLYEKYQRQGEVDLRARPRVVRENPVTALVDARRGLGHPAADFAMRLAIEKARASSVAVVSVVNSHHFGAAGYYASLAAEHGMVGLVTSSAYEVCGLPTRAAAPGLATNPIAFAAPANRNTDFLLDIATTTVAANKIKIYDLTGRPLPEGWVLDDTGKPVRDASTARHFIHERDVGGITMLGGTEDLSSHKGYGLSMMAHILAATLAGGAFPATRGSRSDGAHNIGHFFQVIDPKAFRAEGDFEDDLDSAIDALHDTTPIDPERPVLVAGDPQAQAREERSRDGIPLPPALVEQLEGVCARAGVDFVLAPTA